MATNSICQVSPDWRILTFAPKRHFAARVRPRRSLPPDSMPERPASIRRSSKFASGGHRRLGLALVRRRNSGISMTLLIGASLFKCFRTLVKPLQCGYRPLRTDGVFQFRVETKTQFPPARALAIQSAIVDRLQSIPGVVYASAAAMGPITGYLWSDSVQVEGYVFRPGEDDTVALNAIAPKFFAVTGTPLLLGRDFNERDANGSKPVTIVNQLFVRSFFGGQPPLGRHVTSGNVVYEVVGVVGDAKYGSLRNAMPKTLYIHWMQRQGARPTGYAYFARVAGGDPMRVAPAMERAIPEVDSALRLRTPQTFAEAVDQSTLNEPHDAQRSGRLLPALLAADCGVSGHLLGIMAFQCLQRRINEIGVRLALGATRHNIIAQVLHEVAMMLIPGCAVGCIAAVCLARFAKSMLFGVTPTDPIAFSLAACARWPQLPSRRDSSPRCEPLGSRSHGRPAIRLVAKIVRAPVTQDWLFRKE